MIMPHAAECPAIIAGEKTYSYAELAAAIDCYASQFPERIRRVALLSENRPEVVFTLYAAWRNGTIAIPLDQGASEKELTLVLRDCEPDLVFCSEGQRQKLSQSLSGCGRQPQILVFEELTTRLSPKTPGASAEVHPEDTALIVYTSGTSGVPKGVMLPFRSLQYNAVQVAEAGFYSAETRVLALLPLHHIFPLTGCIVIPLAIGGCVVFPENPTVDAILCAIKEHQVTLLVAVPRFYRLLRDAIHARLKEKKAGRLLLLLARSFRSLAFSRLLFRPLHKQLGGSLQMLISGGAPLSSDVLADLRALGFDLREGYGMTEAGPTITTPPKNNPPGSVGTPCPGTTITVENDEIVVSGPQIMQGYWNRPEETKAVLKDNRLHTGDTGCLDARGFLYLTGRKDEMIVLPTGKKVFPEPLEDELRVFLPLALETAVFARDGQLHAVVVMENGSEEADAARGSIDMYNKQCSPHKRIAGFTIVEKELPKTRLGKLKRSLLPGLASREPKRNEKSSETREYELIAQFLAQSSNSRVFPSSDIEADLGQDSLARLHLAVFLESTFGVRITTEDLLTHRTAAQLAEFVRERTGSSSSPGRTAPQPHDSSLNSVCVVRSMTKEDIAAALQLTADVGWNPGLRDAEVLYESDPRGFFIAEVEGELAGIILCAAFGKDFGFGTCFLVKPEFRPLNVGAALIKRAGRYLGAKRNIAFNAVAEKVKDYQGLGFKPVYEIVRRQGIVPRGGETNGCIPLEQLPFDELAAYDSKIFQNDRRAFLTNLVRQPGTISMAVVENEVISGYGIMRPAHTGYRVEPLFAETPAIAEHLLGSLFAHAEPDAPVIIDVPTPNTHALALADKYFPAKLFRMVRMYRKPCQEKNLDLVYGQLG